MPEPIPNDRDRELAHRALDNSPLSISHDRYLVLRDQVEAVIAEARQEGREESEARIRELEGLNEQSRKLSEPAWPREKL